MPCKCVARFTVRRVGATWFVTRPQPLTLLFSLWSMCVICLVLVCKSGNLIDYWSFQSEVHCITCGGHLVVSSSLSSPTFMTYLAACCVSFRTLSLFASCISHLYPSGNTWILSLFRLITEAHAHTKAPKLHDVLLTHANLYQTGPRFRWWCSVAGTHLHTPNH